MTGGDGRRGGARSLHEIVSRSAPKRTRRTGQPVRRNSYHVGDREKRIWHPMNPREIGPRMKAAEHFDRDGRSPGKRNGPLGHIGIEVLREMYRLVCYRSGRLDPSIDYLQRRLRRSRAAIVSALAALREHGFLGWIRRTEPTENDGAGPQVRQVSNAYWFSLPSAALQFVRRLLRPVPPPDDDSARRTDDATELAAMIETLPLDEQMRALVDNPELAEALARLGAHFVVSSASSPSGQNPASEG